MTPETGTATNSNPTAVRLCRCLADMPLTAFIAALVEGDLSGIVLSGEPTEEQLLEAWEALQTEYIERTAGSKGVVTLLTASQQATEICRLERIAALLTMAIETGHPVLAGELRNDGYEYDPAGTDQERAAQVKMIEAVLSGEQLRITLSKDLSKEEDDENEPGTTLTAAWFEEVLISAGEVLQHYIPPAGLNTLQFTIYYRRLMDHIDRQKKLTSKN